MDLSTEVTERASASLDRLLEKRAARLKEEAEHQREEDAWAESARRDRERRHRENREAWRSYHLLLAVNHEELCEEHRAKAAALSGGEEVGMA